MLTGEKFKGVVRSSAAARPRPGAAVSVSSDAADSVSGDSVSGDSATGDRATESSDFADGVLLGLARSPRRLLGASGALVFFQHPGGFREVHAFDIPAGTRPKLRRFFDRNRAALDKACAEHLTTTLPFGEGFVTILPLLVGEPGHFLGVWFDDRTEPLSAQDGLLLEALAHQATAAILQVEVAHGRAEAAVAAERRRIALDLHDVVVQRIFAAGLQLRSVAGRVDAEVKGDLDRILESLDQAITDVRGTIFDLTRNAHANLDTNAQILMDEYEAFFPEQPTLHCEGALEQVQGQIADQVLAVLRELLSNAARHAEATTCRATLTVDAEHLTLTVADDGRGIDPHASHSGLENVRLRAVMLGGTLDLAGRARSGTIVTWQIPLNDEEAVFSGA